MRRRAVDARRYAWCQGHALWIIGMPARTAQEDLEGAHAAGQEGVAAYAGRMVGEACAVSLNLVVNFARPIPPPAMRASWALDQLRGHELWKPCWELIRGREGTSTAEILEAASELLSSVSLVVGEPPNILKPEGYYPAIATARDWLDLIDAVGEEHFLPKSWTRSG